MRDECHHDPLHAQGPRPGYQRVQEFAECRAVLDLAGNLLQYGEVPEALEYRQSICGER